MILFTTTRTFHPISSRAHDFFVACETIGFYSVTGMQTDSLVLSFFKFMKAQGVTF